MATGEYIARMDADDIALPHRLEQQLAFMKAHPEVGLLSGAYERITRDGQTIDIIRPPLEDREIRAMMQRTNAMCHPAVMMKADVFGHQADTGRFCRMPTTTICGYE